MKTIKDILMDFNAFEEGRPCKVSSVYLYKKLYNLSCEENKNSNYDLKIDEKKN